MHRAHVPTFAEVIRLMNSDHISLDYSLRCSVLSLELIPIIYYHRMDEKYRYKTHCEFEGARASGIQLTVTT